jgi:uncharacterized protein YjbJ (UPF0337 family)
MCTREVVEWPNRNRIRIAVDVIHSEEHAMGIVDKAKNAVQHAAGRSRESIGRATGDNELKNIGKADQRKASVKKAAERVKDVFKH